MGTERQELLLTETGIVHDRGPASYRVAVPCAPPKEPVTFRAVVHELNGCGRSGQITAWLRAAPEAVECGSWDDPRWLRVIAVPSTAPQASAPVFEGGGRCPHLAEIALEPASPAARWTSPGLGAVRHGPERERRQARTVPGPDTT